MEYFFKIFYLFILDKREGRERERDRNIDWSYTPPTGNLAHNPGMCPDRELNWPPFGLWDDAQPTEPCQSGLCHTLKRSSLL